MREPGLGRPPASLRGGPPPVASPSNPEALPLPGSGYDCRYARAAADTTTRLSRDDARWPRRHGSTARRPRGHALLPAPQDPRRGVGLDHLESAAVPHARLWAVAALTAGHQHVRRRLRPDPATGRWGDRDRGWLPRSRWPPAPRLAHEAAAACRDYARDVLKVDRLVAIIDPRNQPSQRGAEKLGLVVERDGRTRG